MKVSQLIERLKQFEQEAEVIFLDNSTMVSDDVSECGLSEVISLYGKITDGQKYCVIKLDV